MKQGQRFGDDTVRWIKESLLSGTHPRAIARHLGVSLITVQRIKDGDTYTGVRVEGEEGLRPKLVLVNAPEGSVLARKTAEVAMAPIAPMTEEAIEAMGKELLERQERIDRGEPGDLGGAKKPWESPEAEARLMAEAKKFF